MKTNDSMRWLREAVGGIKYPPDRRRVERELYAHMLDRNRDFLKAGSTEREADEKVCAALGDPVEVRRELAAIHRPFWGYAYLFLRVLAFAILLWSLGSCLQKNQMLVHTFSPLVDGDRYTLSQWVPQSGKVRCGDYTLRIKRAAYGQEKETGEPCLLLELRAATADPFLGAPYLYFYADLQAEDSRGRTYPVQVMKSRELVFTSSWLLAVRGLDRGADWTVVTMDTENGPVWFTVCMRGSGA